MHLRLPEFWSVRTLARPTGANSRHAELASFSVIRSSRNALAIRLAVAVSLFVSGLAAGLACGSPVSNVPNKVTATVTTNGHVATIVTGP